MTYICVSKLTIIGSDNGLSPGRCQAIIWTNDGILLIGALGTNFSEIVIEIQTFSFWKNRLKVSSAKWRPFCPGLNELTHLPLVPHISVNELQFIGHQWIIIFSGNGLSLVRHQAITWTNAFLLSARLLGTIEIVFEKVVWQNGHHFVQGEMS